MKTIYYKLIKSFRFSLWVLFIGLSITLVAAIYSVIAINSIEEHEFTAVTNEVNTNIDILLKRCSQLLITGVAFFDATDRVNRSDWKIFTQGLAVEKGLQGLGHALIIPKNELSAHIQGIRDQGFPNYSVRPTGDREIYTSIIYLEPFRDRNLRAFGYDMFSELIRNKAMCIARDTGLATLSGKVILVQETTKDIQPGTLMYLPIYKHGQPHSTVEERRRAITGWVYSPYRMKDMLSDILGQYAERQHKQLQLKVYDGEKILAENLLFESKPFNGKVYFSRVYSVIHNNRTWTLVYYQSGYHFPVTPYIKVGWILLIGSFFSFLLFFLIQSMLTTQEKVKVMAGRLSADLVESENKATMASKAKGEFLANMSHEIRTPINGILSMASLLNMSELTPEQSKYSNLIYSSAENLNTLVSSILDYSKIEAGKLDMEFIDFDIVVFIYRLRTVFELQAEKKGLSFVVSMGQTIPSLIKGAEKSLEQILSNFIGNAIKFTENGSIVLEVKIEAELDENISFIFGVRDTGVGIPKEKANELFQVFSQVDNSISRKYGGSGLGLAISKQLAILMGGTVGFESEEGKGSYFWVVIPFKKAIKPQLNNTDNFLLPNFNTPLLPAKSKILVVEDNETNQQVMYFLMAKLGLHADIVNNGKEALASLNTDHYDLVLMDIQMSVMDGIEATKYIRASDAPYREIPIIAVTANAFEADLKKFLLLGMDDYITKPIDFNTLVAMLHKWLKQEPLRSVPSAPSSVEPEIEIDLKLFDEADLLRRLDGDRSIAHKIIHIFLESTPEKINELKRSTKAEDFQAVEQLAHSIKGSSANLGAHQLKHIAGRIETLARLRDVNLIPEMVIKLATSFSKTKKVFLEFGEKE